MLILLAGVAVMAVLASNQMDQSLIPDDQCLQSAQLIADDFQPAADTITGKHLNIKVVTGTPGLIMRLVENRGGGIAVAEINSQKELVVFPVFCAAPLNVKRAIIAHEIGHLIDFSIDASDASSIFWRSWSAAFTPWNLRPMEIAANDYGRELIKLSGGDEKIIGLLGW